MIHSLNKKTSAILTTYLLLAFNLLQMVSLTHDNGFVLYAAEQSTTCAERLDRAEELYYDGEFDKTIEIVNQCLLQGSLPEEEQLRSYTILARTYLAKEDTNLSKDNIRIILKLNPAYQPSIEQETPRYVNLVTQVKKEENQPALAETSAGISSWILIGAGSAAAVAIIAIVASGRGDEKGPTETSLPKPPDFPE